MCAFRGIWQVVKHETNIKIDLAVAAAVVAAGFFFEISTIEWLSIAIVIGLVLAAETFNTAIEHICNKITHNFDREIGTIKDISAGAVLLCAIAAAAVGVIVFLPKLAEFIEKIRL